MPATIKDLLRFGRVVRRARIRKEFSQQKLGSLCGVTGDMISKIERGAIGPSTQTLGKLEKALGISAKNLLEPEPEGEIMKGLQGIEDQVKLLGDRIGKMEGVVEGFKGKGQDPGKQTLPDASKATGDKAQIIKAVSNLEKDVEALKAEAKERETEEIEEPEGPGDADEAIESLLNEYTELKKQGAFKDFDGFFEGEEARRFKAERFVDCCNLCDDLDLDAHEEVESGLFGSKTRGEALRDVIYDFAIDEINADKARKQMEKLLKPGSAGEEEDEDFE